MGATSAIGAIYPMGVISPRDAISPRGAIFPMGAISPMAALLRTTYYVLLYILSFGHCSTSIRTLLITDSTVHSARASRDVHMGLRLVLNGKEIEWYHRRQHFDLIHVYLVISYVYVS